MEFNIAKFLTEHVLTAQSSRLGEDDMDNVLDTTETSSDEDDDYEIDEPTDDWHKAEPDDSAQYEKEPTTKDVSQQEPALSGIHKKQAQLKALIQQKDMLLMQYKSGQMTLDQYREKIGNIPQQIKHIKDQIDQAMNVSADDSSEDEMA